MTSDNVSMDVSIEVSTVDAELIAVTKELFAFSNSSFLRKRSSISNRVKRSIDIKDDYNRSTCSIRCPSAPRLKIRKLVRREEWRKGVLKNLFAFFAFYLGD